MRLGHRTVVWIAGLTAFFLTGCSRHDAVCPISATQRDILDTNVSKLPGVQWDGRIKRAVEAVRHCHPGHPIFGGPAIFTYRDAHRTGNGRLLVRFRVAGLSDISVVYLVDADGFLERAYVSAP